MNKKKGILLEKLTQKYYKDIIYLVPGHIYWKDRNGVFLGCNFQQAKDAGFSSPEELMGKTDYDMPWGIQADYLKGIDKKVMESGEELTLEELFELPDGTKKIYLTTKLPLVDENHEVSGIIGISIDITERRKIETELEGTTQTLENILDTIPGHVYWKDRNGAFLGCNNLQAESFGLSKEEVMGKTDYELQWKETADILRKIDKEVMEKKVPITVEEPGICCDDTIFLSRKVPLYDLKDKNKIIGILGVSFDITEQKLTEKKLSETHHKLQGMTVVSASIAHELRTPLTSLQFGVSNLRRDLSDLIKNFGVGDKSNSLSEKLKSDALDSMKETLDAMNREINMSTLVIDLLLENVKPNVAIKNESFSIVHCVNAALKRYPFTRSQKKLIHWEPQNDYLVEGKELSIAHVLFNLLKNAIYFVAKANKGKIFISLEAGRPYNFLLFKDTGAGISPKNLPHIFDRFFSQTDHGAGIGLAWCKMAIESLGGSIQCESVEGEFTLFKIALPNIEEAVKPIEKGIVNEKSKN